MRIVVVLLASSTVLLAGACAYLLWRSGPAGMTPRANAPTETRINALIAERDRLRSQVAVGGRAVPCDEAAPPPPIGARFGGAAGSPPGVFARSGKGIGQSIDERLSPEHRRTMSRQRYGALFAELSLSEAQVDALLPVLVAQDRHVLSIFDGADSVDPAAVAEREREVAAVIGADKAAQFSQLRATMPARQEVRMLSSTLDSAGVPVSDEQQRRITEAITRMPLPEMKPPASGEAMQDMSARFNAWRTERAKALRDAAAPILTPRQLQRFDENEALHAALMAGGPLAPPPGE